MVDLHFFFLLQRTTIAYTTSIRVLRNHLMLMKEQCKSTLVLNVQICQLYMISFQ